MQQHVKILGVIHIVMGGLCVLIGLVVMIVFLFGGALATVGAAHDPDAAIAGPVLGLIGGFLFFLIAVLAVPGIIAGVGLLKYRPWARILTIVLSALQLISVPIGTALGIYGFWVLLNSETERLFAGPGAAFVPPATQNPPGRPPIRRP